MLFTQSMPFLMTAKEINIIIEEAGIGPPQDLAGYLAVRHFPLDISTENPLIQGCQFLKMPKI